MSLITYGDGTKINFNGTPTQQDIEDAYGQVKGKGQSPAPAQPQAQPDQGGGLWDTLKGAAQTVGNAITPLAGDITQALASPSESPIKNFLSLGASGANQRLQDSLDNNHRIDNQILQAAHAASESGNKAKAQQLLKILQISDASKGPTTEDIATNGQGYATPGKVIGDAAMTGLNALSGGTLAGAGELPALLSGAQPALNTATKGIEGLQGLLAGGNLAEGSGIVPAAAKLSGKAASGGLIGAAQGAAQAAGGGQDVLQGAKSGAEGGAAAGGIFGLGENAVNAVQKASANRAAALYDSVLGITKSEAKAGIKYGTQSAGQKLVDAGGLPGLMKTKQGILDVSQQGIDSAESQLKPLLTSLDKSGVRVPVADIVAPLQKLQASSQELGLPGSTAVQGIIDAITAKGGKEGMLAPTAANDMKRAYYKELSQQNFNVPMEQLSSTKEAVRTAAAGLRQGIESVSPQDATGNAIRNLNAEQGMHLQVNRKITDAIASGQVKDIASLGKVLGGILKPGNLLREGAAAALGGTVGGPVGAAALPAALTALKSTPAMTARAKAGTAFSRASVNPEINDMVRRLVERGGASTNTGG